MNIPNVCPSCDGKLVITGLCCPDCKASITGNFNLPCFSFLSRDEESFLKIFLAARGSIKEVEKRMNISYPTVKLKLERLLSRLGLGEVRKETKQRRLEALEKLERGEISTPEAIKLLKELEGDAG